MVVIEIELCSHVTAVRYRRSTYENLEKQWKDNTFLRYTTNCLIQLFSSG